MLANDLSLDNKDGSDVLYRLVSSSPEGTRRIDIASTLAIPSTLVIKHSQSGKLPNIVDRHLVQVNRSVATSTGTAAVNVNLTVNVPRDVAVTPTLVHNAISNVVDFLLDLASTGLATTANIDAILRGES